MPESGSDLGLGHKGCRPAASMGWEMGPLARIYLRQMASAGASLAWGGLSLGLWIASMQNRRGPPPNGSGPFSAPGPITPRRMSPDAARIPWQRPNAEIPPGPAAPAVLASGHRLPSTSRQGSAFTPPGPSRCRPQLPQPDCLQPGRPRIPARHPGTRRRPSNGSPGIP